MLQVGYLTLFRLRGVPVRAHWSVPVAAFLFGGLALRPFLWLGVFLLILVHELGHLTLIRLRGLAPATVDLHGLGGLCVFGGAASALDRAAVAWGGVLAQAILGATTLAAVQVLGEPAEEATADLVHAFTWSNLFLAGLNLVPFAPLDGHEAWRIFGALRRSRRERRPAHLTGEAPEGADDDPDERGRKGEARRGGRRRSRVDLEEGVAVIDGEEVRETVQRALEEAAREAKTRRRTDSKK